LRAVERGAGRLHDPPDRRAAPDARLVFAIINPQALGVVIPGAVGLAEIKQIVAVRGGVIQRDGAAKPDGFREHLADGAMQACALRAGEAVGGQLRRDACAVEGFTGVDVSHPSHHGLIQQFDFDGLTKSLKRPGEGGRRKVSFQRLRSERRQRCGFEGEPAKIARILVHEPLAAQVQDDGGMFWQSGGAGEQIHSPRHAEVAQQGPAGGGAGGRKREDQVFSATGDAGERGAAQGAPQLGGRRGTDHARAAHRDGADGFAGQTAAQVARQDFDFRQLRHCSAAQSAAELK